MALSQEPDGSTWQVVCGEVYDWASAAYKAFFDATARDASLVAV
jgi:hypothetical protein